MLQVNEFLKLLKHTGLFEELRGREAAPAASGSSRDRTSSKSGEKLASSNPALPLSSCGCSSPVQILDCGCGSSHLTFGLWHYTRNVLGVHAWITGVDSNAGLMARSNQYWCVVRRSMWNMLEVHVCMNGMNSRYWCACSLACLAQELLGCLAPTNVARHERC